MARTNPSEESFLSGMLWDVRRMREESFTPDSILDSVELRIAKYLRYEEYVVSSRIKQRSRKQGYRMEARR